MELTVSRATPLERTLLGNLMQLYLYDFAEFDDREPDADGRFEYRWLDEYWDDEDRYPYVLRNRGGHAIGFALVRRMDTVLRMDAVRRTPTVRRMDTVRGGHDGERAGAAADASPPARQEGPSFEMAEFFILRGYRGRGFGTAAARRILREHPGEWRITEVERNAPAISFWRSVLPVAYIEHVLDDGTHEQRFRID